jgi:hypothetical protein
VSSDAEERFGSILDLLFLYREEPRTASSLRKSLSPGSASMITLKVDKETRACTFSELHASLMDESLDHQLVDFILSRFQQETATELIELVATVLPDLRDWMVSRSPRATAPALMQAPEAGTDAGQEPRAYFNL